MAIGAYGLARRHLPRDDPRTGVRMNVHEDAVIAEVRQARRELSERFGDDLDALCDFLAAQELGHADRLVNLPPKPSRVVAADERGSSS